jgi:hypothetical protein
MNAKKVMCISAGMIGLFATTEAFAQDATGGASISTSGATAAARGTAPVPTTKEDDNTPDHEKFVGHFAVGYFGLANLPIGTAPAAGANAVGVGSLSAPVIGMRYWLQRMIGIDAGIGFANSSGSTEVVVNGTSVSTDKPSYTGFAIHGGVPLALAAGKHFTWELIPELNLGFTSSTIKAPAMSPPGTPDQNFSGFLFNVGARVGAEIHFGFIGVPELALQGSVGLLLQRQAVKVKVDPNSASDGSWTIGTTVGSDPWALFTNNISALYYF